MDQRKEGFSIPLSLRLIKEALQFSHRYEARILGVFAPIATAHVHSGFYSLGVPLLPRVKEHY